MKNQLKLAVLLIGGAVCYNQNVNAQELEYGVKLGATYQFPNYGNMVKGKESKIGAQAGAFLRTANQIYFQPEVLFSMYKSSYSVENTKYDPTFYQVNVPLQVGYKFLEEDQWNLRASIGPQVNYNLKSNKAVGNSDYKDLTFDGLINVGVDLKQFTIDLRYNQGLSKTSDELDAKNNVLGLSVGYKF